MIEGQSISEFIKDLGSRNVTPSGGAASALTGCIGINLVKMAIEVTIGKEGYEEFEEVNRNLKNKLENLSSKLIQLANDDIEAYNLVVKAYKTENNEVALENALKNATVIPYQIMENSLEGLDIANFVKKQVNINAKSDLQVGIYNLEASIKGGYSSVSTNLLYIKDLYFIDEYKKMAMDIINVIS